MRYHVVLSRNLDFDRLAEESSGGIRPRHAMKQLAERLGAEVHMPVGSAPSLSDRIMANLIGTPALWRYAREVVTKLSSDDVLYCPDEAIGLPLAYLCNRSRNRAKSVVMVHNIDRPRTRLALWLLPGTRSADMFVSVSHRQLDFLRGNVGIPADRTRFIPDQTDLDFFKPGPMSADKTRPLLVSAGLERRDYKILAEVAGDLDVDVAVTGFSTDAAAGTSSFPESWPANFTRRRYEWTELARLYRDADAVVVTLLPNIYAAGITSMVEGMACARPIIVTRTEGLKGYLDDDDAVTVVPHGNAAELRSAILALIGDPAVARSRGLRAAAIATERYGSETHVENIATLLESLR